MKSLGKLTLAFFLFLGLGLFVRVASASVLLPGDISSCGELAVPGVYTLTQDVSASGTSTCFLVSSDNVTLDGAGYSVSGSGPWAIDARAYDVDRVTLTKGANAFTNVLVNNISVLGFSGGINASGNSDTDGLGVNAGYGGTGGDVEVLYSRIGSVFMDGGNSSTKPYGGAGGSIIFNDDDLDISSSTISALGGSGTVGRNTDGGLDLNYTGALSRNGLSLSSLSFFNDNVTSYGLYPGGSWPMVPGPISSCGTLYTSGTYTLTQDLSGISGTCFVLAANNVVLDGAGHSISSLDASTTAFAIQAGTFSSFTLASTTVLNYPNLVISSSSVSIIGHDIDLSNTFIAAGSLTLSYTGTLTKANTRVSALSSLVSNSVSHGSMLEGFLLDWTARGANWGWTSVASSADGTKLVAVASNGPIYTSTDSGVTWTSRDSNRSWWSVASSADGTKLVAAVSGGRIYTSTDSGVTWTARESVRAWYSVASSADGTKLVAALTSGLIYISRDSGLTWVERVVSGTGSIYSVASSADGEKLVLVKNSGQIYTSTDSGVTWTARESVRAWYSVASSADGTKLVAAVSGGRIYTSIDSGVTWFARDSVNRDWRSVASSADGTKLVAVASNGPIYTSTDSGATWTARDSVRGWRAVASSADGTKLVAAASTGLLYVHADDVPTLSVAILNIKNPSGVWQPRVSWGSASSCHYSYDGFVSTSTADCSLGGSDIPSPAYGSGTLYVRASDSNGFMAQEDASFSFGLPISIVSPVFLMATTTWNPSIDWDPLDSGDVTGCYYSYDGFVSTSTADCSFGGFDVFAPADGFATLSLRVLNAAGDYGENSVYFHHQKPFLSRNSGGFWRALASSADGTKLVAGINGGQLYTSTDSGVTWVSRVSGANNWYAAASSADGTKLVAVVSNGRIYTSTDSGVNWTMRDSNRGWRSVASSADGTKLVAVVASGQIYTSTDSGVNWTARDSSRNWVSVASSADGTKLAAVVFGGQIYTSANSGVTWTARDSSRNWNAVTSSADGTLLAAVVSNGQIYVSTDSGATWTPRELGRNWYAITSSSDGTRLAAVVSNGQIYTSTDSGATWTPRESNRVWNSVASSADGAKLVAAVSASDGFIYTLDTSNLIPVLRPMAGSNLYARNWSPAVNWGNAVACYYSYDNFVSTTTVSCANDGSDIASPSTRGLKSLSLRSLDGLGVYVNSIVSFSFDFFFSAAESSRSWIATASSADGTKLVAAVSGGRIYTSTDSGATWTARDSNRNWTIVASSADGAKLAAVAFNGQIYTSVNSGATWTARDSVRAWTSVASSADGTKLVAGVQGGRVYTSTDSGVNWTVRNPVASVNRSWRSVASSADGTKLVAVVENGQIYTSTDSGVNWTVRDSNRAWYSVASSADGTKLVAVVSGGQIYTSVNSGATWTARESNRSWRSVASSDDGTKLVALADNGYMYTSIDSGVTWASAESVRAWRSVSSSADGTRLVAVASNSRIYVTTSLVSVLAPVTGSSITSWTPSVSWDKSVTCEYSYDSLDWATAGCSLAGSDIPAPSPVGSTTLYLKGTDLQGAVSTTSSSFLYLPPVSSGSINSCGTLASSTAYTLSADITGVSGVCFLVTADNVTLNGAGHTITATAGNSSYAVSAWGRSGLVLDEVAFTGFRGGSVAASSVSYSGADIDLTNATTTAFSINISYADSLTSLGTYLSGPSGPFNLSINGIDLQSVMQGLFAWSQNDISACGTISNPGLYRLTQDISGVEGTCFSLETGTVIFDGAGHTITGAPGNTEYAFVATSTAGHAYSNIAIKNLALIGFGGGVDARGRDGSSGDATGTDGGVVSLYSVLFPPDTVSANTSGGDGLFENDSVGTGGNGGSVKVASSTVGTIIASGGDTNGDETISGYNVGEFPGGVAGGISVSSSTLTATTSSQGRGYIPGCMDDSYSTYNPLATYDDGTCTNIEIGLGRDNVLGSTVSGPLYFYLFSNFGTVNGDAEFYSNDQAFESSACGTGNYGTTTGYAHFFDPLGTSCGPVNNGYVGGGASFHDSSSNDGTVDGDVIFAYGYNYGTINGNVDFTGNGINSSAVNFGTVNGNATFYANGYLGSYNYGTVTGSITYLYGCTDPLATNYEPSALYDDAGCSYIGITSDNSEGNTVPGPIFFQNYYSNYGTVTGDATFYYGSYNYGTVTGAAIFETGSYNSGTVLGNADFQWGSNNYGSVLGDAIMYDLYNPTYGSISTLYIDGNFPFYGTGRVGGTIYDQSMVPLTFFDFSNGQGLSSGYVVQGNSVFNDTSWIASATIVGNAVFDDFSYAESGSVIEGDATFNDSSFMNNASVLGDVTFNTNSYASTTPAGGVFSFQTSPWNNNVVGTVYGSDGNPITDYEFFGSIYSVATITGNAIYHDASSYQAHPVTGNVTLDTSYYGGAAPTSSVFTITNRSWVGMIGGTLFSSDGITPITDFNFTGTATNGTQSIVNGDATFSGSAQNLGIINGDASFGSVSPFRIGVVNGTSTLTGTSQTLTGNSTTTALVKSLGKDTLYLTSASTLAVGSVSIGGSDAGNLLTIRSTVPGSAANLRITGDTSGLNFIRLKDVRNVGDVINFTGRTVYDDGGNTGFIFNENAQAGSRSSLTSGATRPPTPIDRAVVAAQVAAARAAAEAAARAAALRAAIRPAVGSASVALREFRKATAESLSTVAVPVSLVGRLPALTALPVFGGTGENSFSFQAPISGFLFTPISNSALSSFSESPRLKSYLASLGISGPQSLARIHVSPKVVVSTATKIPGIYSVSVADAIVQTMMTSDGGESVFQRVTVAPGSVLTVSVSPVNGDMISADFNGRAISFDESGSVSIVAPFTPGSYILTSSASPLPMAIQVVQRDNQSKAQVSGPPVKSVWKRLLGFFGIR